MKSPLSKYSAEIVQFHIATKAKACYCFVIDGDRGTGGMPLLSITTSHEEYIEKCKELIAMLRRSADLLDRDISPSLGNVDVP